MIISKRKTEIVLARRGTSFHELCSVFSPGTVDRMRNGKKLSTKTVHKLAVHLDCDPADLVDLEERANG